MGPSEKRDWQLQPDTMYKLDNFRVQVPNPRFNVDVVVYTDLISEVVDYLISKVVKSTS